MNLALPIFLCLVAAVHDGDTLRCRDGTRVRLAAIDAPEVGECPRWKRCAPGNAEASRRALAGMVLGRRISCAATGHSYDRVTAWCSINGRDVSCTLFRGGWASRRWDRDRMLCRRH